MNVNMQICFGNFSLRSAMTRVSIWGFIIYRRNFETFLAGKQSRLDFDVNVLSALYVV